MSATTFSSVGPSCPFSPLHLFTRLTAKYLSPPNHPTPLLPLISILFLLFRPVPHHLIFYSFSFTRSPISILLFAVEREHEQALSAGTRRCSRDTVAKARKECGRELPRTSMQAARSSRDTPRTARARPGSAKTGIRRYLAEPKLDEAGRNRHRVRPGCGHVGNEAQWRLTRQGAKELGTSEELGMSAWRR